MLARNGRQASEGGGTNPRCPFWGMEEPGDPTCLLVRAAEAEEPRPSSAVETFCGADGTLPSCGLS